MDNQKWKAIVEDWRKVPARKSNKGVKPRRVRSHDEGKAGRESKR